MSTAAGRGRAPHLHCSNCQETTHNHQQSYASTRAPPTSCTGLAIDNHSPPRQNGPYPHRSIPQQPINKNLRVLTNHPLLLMNHSQPLTNHLYSLPSHVKSLTLHPQSPTVTYEPPPTLTQTSPASVESPLSAESCQVADSPPPVTTIHLRSPSLWRSAPNYRWIIPVWGRTTPSL